MGPCGAACDSATEGSDKCQTRVPYRCRRIEHLRVALNTPHKRKQALEMMVKRVKEGDMTAWKADDKERKGTRAM